MVKTCPGLNGHSPTWAAPASQLFNLYISLQIVTNRLHKKQKADSVRAQGWVTLLGEPKFCQASQPGELVQGETIRVCASAVGPGKGVIFFRKLTWAHDPLSRDH